MFTLDVYSWHGWGPLFIVFFQSLSSPVSHCKRHQVSLPRIVLRDLAPELILDKNPPTPPISNLETCQKTQPCTSPKDNGDKSGSLQVWTCSYIIITCVCASAGGNSPRSNLYRGGAHSVGCLRHGPINNAQAVKAIYLLMGGAAASSTIGYLGTCSLSNLDARAPDMPMNADFSGVGPAQVYQAGGPSLDSPHYNSFDFEMADSDFDAFDCGGFTFWAATHLNFRYWKDICQWVATFTLKDKFSHLVVVFSPVNVAVCALGGFNVC